MIAQRIAFVVGDTVFCEKRPDRSAVACIEARDGNHASICRDVLLRHSLLRLFPYLAARWAGARCFPRPVLKRAETLQKGTRLERESTGVGHGRKHKHLPSLPIVFVKRQSQAFPRASHRPSRGYNAVRSRT